MGEKRRSTTNTSQCTASTKPDTYFAKRQVRRELNCLRESLGSTDKTNAVAIFNGAAPLESGWAWGQQYLDGGTAIAEASVGEGKVVLLGPEVNFRDQPAGTYKLLFNGLYYGNARTANLP